MFFWTAARWDIGCPRWPPIKLPEGVVFSTLLSDHMAECSRRRSVVQSVADEAAPRATSVPPTSEPRARPPPKKRCSLGSLRKFGARIQDLPRPVPLEEDLRGNYMSASSTGHIHKKENLERAWWGGSTSAVTENSVTGQPLWCGRSTRLRPSMRSTECQAPRCDPSARPGG